MKYHHICIECGNPTPEEQTNIVLTDIMDKPDEKRRQVYCSECFKSITKDTIAKHKKRNNNSNSNSNSNNNNKNKK